MLTPTERRQLAYQAVQAGNASPGALAVARWAVARMEREADRLASYLEAESEDCPDGPLLQALIKPVGDRCNLRCRYCFNNNSAATPTMTPEVLEAIIAGSLALYPAGVSFAFHGGEALLAGRDFFRLALELQARHARPGQIVRNRVQTNATLLDRDWAELFAAHSIGVGVSLDGPAAVHDANRVDAAGRGSMDRVVAGIRAAQAAGLEVGAISVVTCPPLLPAHELARAVTGLGISRWRVNPCRHPDTVPCYGPYVQDLYDWWGEAGCAARIAILDETLGVALGYRPTTCWTTGGCPHLIGFDPDGTVSPCCEMSVDPRFWFGNLRDADLGELLGGARAREFWAQRDLGDRACQDCAWTDYCGGGCTFHRLQAAGTPAGQDYLCDAYRDVFSRLVGRFDRDLTAAAGVGEVYSVAS